MDYELWLPCLLDYPNVASGTCLKYFNNTVPETFISTSPIQQLTNNMFDGLEYVEEKVAEVMEDAKKLWDAQSAAIERRRQENNEKYTEKRNRMRLNKVQPWWLYETDKMITDQWPRPSFCVAKRAMCVISICKTVLRNDGA